MRVADGHHGLERPALAECDHRRAARLRFERDDAEILFGGEYESSRTLQVALEHADRLIAEYRHIRPGLRANRSHLRSIADHDQLAMRRRAERLDNQIDALVRHHS